MLDSPMVLHIMKPVDKLGKEIKAGDYIVYAQRQSSSLWLTVGKVLSVGTKVDYTGRETLVARVRGCSRWGKPSLQNPGNMTVFDRVIVIPEQSVPEEYFNLLKDL